MIIGAIYKMQMSCCFIELVDFTSTILTVVGYSVLVYRIIFELESGKMKKSRQEELCTKWLIFTIFLKLDTTFWQSSRSSPSALCSC
jgi:hypothetical protein